MVAAMTVVVVAVVVVTVVVVVVRPICQINVVLGLTAVSEWTRGEYYRPRLLCHPRQARTTNNYIDIRMSD